MYRQRHLQNILPGGLIPLTDDQIINFTVWTYGKGYWLVSDPTRYVTLDLVNLGVDNEYLGAMNYDRFVYWPDYYVAGRVHEIVSRFRQAGVTNVHVGELHKLSNGKFGDPFKVVPLTEENIMANSLDPLNPVHQKFIMNQNVSKKSNGHKRVGLIPYSIYDGKLVFLFGKNVEERHWSSSGYWTDFGGSPEQDETIYETAAREGFEESMGFLGSRAEILTAIKGTKSYPYGNSVLIPYRLDYDEASQWPEIYKRTYQYMSACFKTTFLGTPSASCCPEGFFEKVEIEWFEYEYIEENPNLFIRQLPKGINHLRNQNAFV